MRWRNLKLGVWLLGLLAFTPAGAQDLVVEKAWFAEGAEPLSFEQVQQESFTPYSELLTRGYQQTATWVRLTIDPARAVEQGPHILRIQPQYLDYITLFDPLVPSDDVRQTGDMTRWSVDEYQSLNFNFVVPVGDAPRDLYLRLDTESTTLLAVEVLPVSQVMRLDRLYEVFASLLLAILLLIAIWVAFQWVLEPNLLLGSFLVKQIAVFTHAAGYTGYWRLWLSDMISPALLNELFNLNIFVMTAAAIWFIYQFLKEYDPKPLGIRLFAGSLLLFPLQLILQWLGHVQMALQTVALLSLCLPFLSLYIAATARVWKRVPREDAPVLSRNQLVLLFFLLAMVLWVYVLPVLGLLRVEPLTLYGIVLYNLVTSLMMMAALLLRARYRNLQQAKVQARLALAEQEVAQERMRREDQKRFLDMLTHELKNPLTTIRMRAFGTADKDGKIKAAVADMQQVIDRCVQYGQLEGSGWQLHTETVNLNSLLTDCVARLSSETHAVELSGVDDLPHIESDTQLLTIIIQNLLDNAVKYSPPKSVVQINGQRQVSEGREGIKLMVVNEVGAAGYPDEQQVFQKYYRSPHAQNLAGSGLGLPLAHGLATLLQGQLTYVPPNVNTDQSVRFCLWLPVSV